MNDETSDYSSYLKNSTCYRYIQNDDKVYVRLVIIGLTYIKNELCRVFANKLTDDEKLSINKHKKSYISFDDKIISPKQIENIRDSRNTLHNQLVTYLIQKYNINTDISNEEQLKKLSREIQINIIIYSSKKEIIFQSHDYKYDIYGVIKNHIVWGISDIKLFKSTNEVIQEERKEKTITAGCKSVSFDENQLKSCLKNRLTEKEQLELYNNMKNQEMTEYGITELISSISNNVIQKILSTNMNNEECRIKEWIFAISCNTCKIGSVYECKDYKSLFKHINKFNSNHECDKNRSREILVKICKNCKLYKFWGITHECKNNRRKMKVDSTDGERSIYFNEKEDLSLITK